VEIQVVGLGAWCDSVSSNGADNWLRFRVEEFATLSDRRRLTLSDDRGWTSSIHTVPAGLLPPDPWADLSVEGIEQDVRNVVLPDDAEQTGDEHPWAVLTARIRALGVETTPELLRNLPYEVILSPGIQARLSTSS